MKHLDLFSGIGGFALAADWVWGDEHEIVSFCEIDPFCQKVLKKHWPDVPIISDIKEFKYHGGKVCLITGGPPCQATSVAASIQGKRTGKTLYPDMDRVVSLVRPQWVIVEQPAGNTTWENQVTVSLASIGYHTAKFKRQASDYSLFHRRRRVFIVANTSRKRLFEIARLGESPPVKQGAWVAPPRGTWRSTRTGNCGVDDGDTHWTHRLKALGNAVSPPMVVPIMQAIKELT